MKEKWLTFADFLSRHFPGKMQKISINAGFSCPNRDGTLSSGGCTYCLNRAFVPGYCQPSDSVTRQLEKGKEFFKRKYPGMRYLAYFQGFTSTHGRDISSLMALYREAEAVDGVDGIIIGTRPDCVNPELLERLKKELPWVMMEYGVETSHDVTHSLVNRRHTWQQACRAVEMTAERGIPVGVHLIMGLPGETPEMMFQTIDRINLLPVDVVKIHRLQVLKGTILAKDLAEGRYDIMRCTADEYAALCAQIIRHLRPGIAIDRFVSQSPPELVLYPRYNLKNYQFVPLIIKALGDEV